MAFRVLTDVFILMRNNSITNKNVFHNEQYTDDRTALVLNLETNTAQTYSTSQPEWSNDVDQIQYEITKIKNKLKELSILHDKHLNRPTLDDNSAEEAIIDALTQEITQNLASCQLHVKRISTRSARSNRNEQLLARNVVNSLARSLQDLTIEFRKAQSVYLNKIKSREERSKFPFSQTNFSMSSSILMEDFNEFDSVPLKQEQDLLSMELKKQNEVALEEREKEINHIVRSIQELNDIFRDLATMIVDQGTVLDRIDCNIEKASVHVKQGLEELNKASKYQKSDRKMKVIFILSIIVIVLFILLIIFKI